jgi:two-component system, sensor histidine kinase RegB
VRLAAGAAHELGSPLTTIEVAAHEAELRAAKLSGAGAIAEDLKLIRLEVDRCQNILHQMAARAAQAGECEPLSADRLVERVRELLGEDRGKRVEFRLGAGELRFGRALQMAQSLAALIKNALDASAPSSIVVVTMRARRAMSRSRWRIAVRGSPRTCWRASASRSSPPSSPASVWAWECSWRARSSRAAAVRW